MPDAARRRACRSGHGRGSGTRPAAQRALLRPSAAAGVVAVLLAVLGFAFVVQVRDTAANDTYAGLRESDLIQVFDGLTGTAERARREVDRLEARRDELQDESRPARPPSTRPSSGSAPSTSSPGWCRSPGRACASPSPRPTGRVSVGSLLDTVQELRTAGAEAMEFNDIDPAGRRQLLRGRHRRDRARRQAAGVAVRPRGHRRPAQPQDGPDLLRRSRRDLQTEDGATVDVEELDSVEITSVREAVRPEMRSPSTAQ